MRPALLACLLLFHLTLSARAQESPPTPAAQITIAPPETKEVIAEGRAAIGTGGIPGAREAATHQALRAAVEKATGIYVSARTLTHNYQLLQDEITTRAEGFATLREIIRVQATPGEVCVTVRALVSLRPLAKRLKELKLTRAWRVRVETEGKADVSAAVATLERTLSEAGFVVVTQAGEAPEDITVRLSPKFTTVTATPLETAAGPMTFHSIRGEMTIRALRSGTNEVVAALSASDVAAHIEAATVREATSGNAVARLAPRLADALMLLPAQASQPVTLIVANLTRITQVGELHDALRHLPGVRSVTRRAWENRVATWELDVTTDAVSLLARALEEDANMSPFRLTVSSETRTRISACLPAPKAAKRL